jgi:hypothetical protein
MTYCRVRSSTVVPQESVDPKEFTACFVLSPLPDPTWARLFKDAVADRPIRLTGDRAYVQGRNRIDVGALLELVDAVNEERAAVVR